MSAAQTKIIVGTVENFESGTSSKGTSFWKVTIAGTPYFAWDFNVVKAFTNSKDQSVKMVVTDEQYPRIQSMEAAAPAPAGGGQGSARDSKIARQVALKAAVQLVGYALGNGIIAFTEKPTSAQEAINLLMPAVQVATDRLETMISDQTPDIPF